MNRRTGQELTKHRNTEEELLQRTHQLEALRRVGLEITTEIDPNIVLQSIVSQAVDLVDGLSGGLYLYQPERDLAEWRNVVGPNPIPLETTIRRGEGIAGKVWETLEPLTVQDSSEWRERAPNSLNPPNAAMVYVPICWTGEFLGILTIIDHPTRTFSPHDIELLKLFATQAAIAIRNARLFTSLEQEKEQINLLYRLNHQLSESLDVQEVAQRALADVCDSLRAISGIVLAREQDSDRLQFVAISGYDEEPLEELTHRLDLKTGDGLVGWVAQHRQSALVDDVTQDKRWMVIPGMDEGVRSALSVPLLSRDTLVGVINIYSDKYRYFNENDRRLAESVAATIAAAITNAQLFEAEQHRRQEAETLRKAALALTTTLSRDEVIDRILAQLQEVVPYDSASVQLLRGNHLEIVGGRGFPNLSELIGLLFHINGDNPNSQVIRTRAPFIVNDAPAIYDDFKREPHAQAGIRAWLGVPMKIGERLTGMIALDKTQPGFYTPEHARLAEAFAAQAAIAIENARLFQSEQEQRALGEALGKAAAVVSRSLDHNKVLDRILEQVERVVGGDAFNVMLVEGDAVRIVRNRGYTNKALQDSPSHAPFPISKYPPLLKMKQTGSPIHIPDTLSSPDWIPAENNEWRRSYIAAPIQAKDAIVGFLNVNGTRPNQFNDADVHRLQAFANHAAVAIENARLYQELRHHAEQLEKRVEERTAQIQAQYAQLETILHSTTDGIIAVDHEGQIIQMNPIAHRWLHQTLSPEDASRLRETVRDLTEQAIEVCNAPESSRQKRSETVLELKGLDLELKAAPICEPATGKTAAVIAAHDVSHLKALDRMKNRFVSSVSHELRTPVTTIKLFASLLKQSSLDKQREYLDALEQEANRQARLVEDILQVSKIDAGRMELDLRPASVNELVRTVVHSHQLLARNKSLVLEFTPSQDPGTYPPLALVDTERMMQVLNNLVENSIYYTPEGGRIAISTSIEEREGRVWAIIAVSDTGQGIPQDELPHIFERFFRGEHPREAQVPGTGLGLAIVKDIVELHGGQVTVYSEVDVGSTFSIWLPLAS